MLRRLSVCVAFATIATFALPTARAADEQLIRMLEEKGYLTEQEAQQIISSESEVDFKPNTKRTTEISLGAMIQFQYNSIQADNGGGSNPGSRNNFQMRRLYLELEGKIGEGFGGVVVPNFGGGKARLDHAYLYKTVENPDINIYAGLRKVRFSQETYASTSKLRTVERSIVSSFWGNDTGTESEMPAGTEADGNLGFAAQHLGVFTDYQIDDNYAVELDIVNGYAGQLSNNGFQNTVGGYVQFRGDWDLNPDTDPQADKMHLQAGLNVGYQPSGNSYWQPTVSGGSASGTNPYIGYSDGNSANIGLNPYVGFSWEKFKITGEFIVNWIEHGQLYGSQELAAAGTVESGQAMPWGVVVTPSYMFLEDFEAVVQFAYIDSGERGVQMEETLPNSPAVGRIFFNRATSYYVGVNWYILGNDAKIQLGYNYVNYMDRYMMPGSAGEGTFSGPDYSAQAIRLQMQLIF